MSSKGSKFFMSGGKSTAKGKQKKKTNLNDFMFEKKEEFSVPIINNPNNIMLDSGLLDNVQDNKGIELEQQKILKYNDSLSSNDDMNDIQLLYHSFIPTNKVLIRLYAKPHTVIKNKDKEDIILASPIKIPMMTKNGQGLKDYVSSPYRVTTKAVIISIPEYLKSVYDIGDIIQINDIPVRCPLPGNPMIVPYDAFIHADRIEVTNGNIPSDVTHPDYGYYLIDSNKIEGIIQRNLNIKDKNEKE